MIRIIYKDKNVGRVNESRLDELIKSDRIAAFCRPNDEWVGVKHEQTRGLKWVSTGLPGNCGARRLI